ncbi:radical SAM family heme chaperone HemW [Fulvivirga maritima]|uniref:radical SAM family heme chaperone HemW n=1 Tax=Fulvivirga maritima TaxID=2904247 RepID=UPI001F30FFD6|nr:radical SAM family heme chaperone HemW [Fulvivirga maritima]UII28487.1 radical SAM family heme chaperone HemW [Fulvivirga maritima]
MAGIYIHIPFCKQACHYCDFHFSTNQKYVNEMTVALCEEIKLQHNYLEKEPINTVYFGGGTPSILSKSNLGAIFEAIHKYFNVKEGAEITLEANPDDLTSEKLHDLYDLGVNRLSIGIQSFKEQVLQFLNRAHNRGQALSSVNEARNVGFNNISIDLIYGIPVNTHEDWVNDLDEIAQIRPEHISSYCLTIEPKTVFGHRAKKGTLSLKGEDFEAKQYDLLISKLKNIGYEHYEVSNFSLPGKHSRHNSSYWKQDKYLGIGPGAHSYNGNSRQFNISNNPKYISSLKQGNIPAEYEVLSREDKVNEYLLTGLRTLWGVDLNYLKDIYNYDLKTLNDSYLKNLISNKFATLEANDLKLTEEGLLLADEISSSLFI